MLILFAPAIALLMFLASVTVILLIVGPTILLKPRRRTAEFYQALGQPVTPDELHLAHEQLTITTPEGVKLDCWLIKANAPVRGTILYLHGVGDCKIDGLRFAKLMHDRHFNVFLYDSRRHGQSEGKFCTYGFFEKHDTIQIIEYLAQRRDLQPGNIGIFGTSMGAAVAIQAAALDRRITAIVAENSFATLRSIFDDYQRRLIRLPFHYLRNLVIKRSEVLAHFKASEVSPLQSVQNIHVPILFIYGTDDRLIRSQYTLALYERTPGQKELYPIENASHTDTWKIAGAAYENRLVDFFERNLH